MKTINFKNFLTIFLFAFSSIFSGDIEDESLMEPLPPEQISDLNDNNDQLIGGLVSPLSGHLCMRNFDLVAKGAQDVVLSRTFIASYMPKKFHEDRAFDQYHLYNYARIMKGWVFFPHYQLQLNTLDSVVLLTLPNGVSLKYQVQGYEKSSKTSLFDKSAIGICNYAQELPSGSHDLCNVHIFGTDNWNKIVVNTPDGKSYYYRRLNSSIHKPLIYYFLEKERLPNGKILRYTMDTLRNAMHKSQVVRIESCDPQERFVYASIDVKCDPKELAYHFVTNTGQEATYQYEVRKKSDHIKRSKEELEYATQSSPFLTAVCSPFYRKERMQYSSRFLWDTYFRRNTLFSCGYGVFQGESEEHYRVKTISKPVGSADANEVLYDIDYQVAIPKKSEGKTSVKHADGSKTVYHFTPHLLIKAIQYFDPDGKLKKEKTFSWDKKHWLTSIILKDGEGNVFYSKSYSYDAFGNPILEVTKANFSGESEDEASVKRKFSQDGRNLLLKEQREEGETTCYHYLQNTNLKTAIYTKADAKIIRRNFFDYDDCHNLVRKIEDDGGSLDSSNLEGVSQRKVTTYILKQQQPFLHMHEWVIESYIENGEEKLLQKKKLSYNSLGCVSQEDIYDANGEFAYSILKEYNERGDILSETNALGQKARYDYDESGNQLLATSFSEKSFKTMQYDTLGRMRQQVEGNAQINQSKFFEYDKKDRLVRETDGYDNPTQYLYDPIANKVSSKICPPIVSLDGVQRVTLSTCYDSFGRAIAKTDANGNTTYFKYNVYDSPIKIIHVNDSKEFFRYSKRGRLLHYKDQDGYKTDYTYDPLGRITSKTSSSLTEYFEYSGFNLIKKIDKEGHATHYLYDGAGRLIQEQFCNKVTEFAYDSLGRQSKIVKHNQDNTLVISFKRDLLDRVVERTESALSGDILYQIQYAYDEEGNRSEITRFIANQPAKVTFGYDPLKRLIHHQDFSGNVTTTQYSDFSNSLGQRVLLKTIEDPEGVRTIEEYNPFEHVVNRFHEDFLYTHNYTQYDLAGNLLEESLINGLGTIHYRYDTQGRQSAINSPYFNEEYTYSPKGHLITRTCNQGSNSYTYDPLSQLTSECGNANQSYEYDALYNRICKNGKHCLNNDLNELTLQDEFICTYDLNGNLIQKVSPEGIFKFVYDPLNRLIQADKDNQIIKFTYDPLGRRLTKSVTEGNQMLLQESYLYDGMEEIGALTPEGKIKQFRVLGLSFENNTYNSVAIELNDQIFAAISDRQRNIRILVDSTTKKAEDTADFTAFGEVINEKVTRFNPWRYAAKRYDSELGLINFGKRYYDPQLARWLSLDPAGFKDSRNLYQYLLNNPYTYVDPDGKFIIPLVFLTWGAATTVTISVSQILIGTALTALAIYGGERTYHFLNDIKADYILNQLNHEYEYPDGKTKVKGTREKAPYNPSKDPTECPSEGFEWEGKGSPESQKGSWYNPQTDESLHPDLKHKEPIGPHWDYRDKHKNEGRIDEDGIIEWK